MKYRFLLLILFLGFNLQAQKQPNVIIIYVDDLGIGDVSAYGATKIQTPNLDKMAEKGVRFTNARSTSSTCTPSRYSLMTGNYPWRQEGVRILPGDAGLIVPTNETTIAKVFKKAGYTTGIVGKWHLGLGEKVDKDWSQRIGPGPAEVGFDYSFIFPATADRVPTVFLENQQVIAWDEKDPLEVNYKEKIGNEPTGRENPELLKMKASPNHGHDHTIVNGVGRIGWKSGGKMTSWVDEEVPFSFLHKAQEFVEENSQQPFFLMYTMTEPHVPRVPMTIFKSKSDLGYRGDLIMQMDWAVGEIMKQLKYLGIDKSTIIVFSSDNGPVLDDGYMDDAVEKQNGHNPNGIYRGGKYSIFEAGTRVPMIVSWPRKIKKPVVSNALFPQMDFLASFAAMLKVDIPERKDSQARFKELIGKSTKDRDGYIIDSPHTKAYISGDWKYIVPANGNKVFSLTNIESGLDQAIQLYNLKDDPGETNNLASHYPEKVKELVKQMERIELLRY